VTTAPGTRYDRYEERSSGPLSVLAGVFLLVYGAPILWQDMPSWLSRTCAGLNTLVWVVFVVDFAIRLVLVQHRARFVLTHPIEVLTVFLPMLRPMRVLRVFAATHTLFTRGGGLLRGGQAIVVSTGLLVGIGALAVLDAERGAPDALITEPADALWWAITTVTTVGYGDLYPVTGTGRIVAAALMLVGISLVGTVTATVATWFVAQRADDDRTRDQLAELTEQVAALREELAASRRS